MGPKPSGRAKVSKSSEDSEKLRDSHKRRRTSPQSGNPRHGPGPTISTQGGQAADKPSSHHSGAHFDASSFSDRELQEATTGFAGLGISAFAPPLSGTPALEPPLYAPYYQPETPFPSSQHGQYGVYPIGQREQYGAYPIVQHEQYGAYSIRQHEQYGAYSIRQHEQHGAYPPYQPGQYNAQHSEHARFQPKPIPRNPYLNDASATGMGTAIAAPVGHQPETRDPTKSRRATAPQPSLGEEPQRQEREPGQQQSRDWKDVEDEKLVSLKKKYDKKSDKWARIAKELSKESKQKITSNDCQRRWDAQQREKAKQESWLREEEENNRLTEFVKSFDKWDTLNGWEEISEQMKLAGLHLSPENCRRRWQETLRGPARIGAWAEDEEKFLEKHESQYNIVELVDLLERLLGSIRDIKDCAQKVSKIRNSQENTVNWTPDADQELINFNERQRRVNHIATAEELNKAFHTNHFTPAECEKRWTMLK